MSVILFPPGHLGARSGESQVKAGSPLLIAPARTRLEYATTGALGRTREPPHQVHLNRKSTDLLPH